MRSLSRRDLMRVGGTLLAFAGLPSGAASAASARAPGPPFAHGVASGDPLPDSVLLWTRVTPTPDALPGSGAGPDVVLDWEVAADPSFRDVVARGSTTTGASRDHTVKVDVRGLSPARWYWYRFRFGDSISPVGRTRTAAAAGSALDRLRMGVVSCSNWQAGYFAAYRHLAARDDLDFVLHLGDYVYEYAPGEFQARDVVIRPHEPQGETTVLEHYRRRHAQYKTDPDLQALHSTVPFIATWDDHESANDAWSGGAQNHTEPGEGVWAERRAASQRAYAEWMPVRYEAGGRIYRRFGFGSLVQLSMLDLRSYRSQQVSTPLDPSISDPARTITGDEQMRWLTTGLLRQDALWNLVGNSVMIAPVRFPSTLSTREHEALAELTGAPPIEGVPYSVDQWDGYPVDRAELLNVLRDNGVRNTVFLTGDIHSAWAAELPADALSYPASGETVATELVCTSVTSDNLDDLLRVPPRTVSVPVEGALRATNPHVKHVELDSHGYSVVDVSPQRVQMDWFALDDRTDPATEAHHATSFAVPAGTQRLVPVDEPVR